jgi:uncharacterized protein YkwD
MTIRPLIRLAAVTLALLVALPAAMAAAQAPAGLSPAEQEALTRINAYRTGQGLKPVRLDPVLQREAEWYATDMAAHDNFNHEHRDSLGRLPASRLASFSYPFADLAAENTAAGYGDGDQVFEQWHASPPHDRTMRESTYHAIGISAAYNPTSSSGWYWVSVFGPDPSRRARQEAEAAQGAASVTIRVPILPLAIARDCATAIPGEHCVHISSSTSRAPVEIQIQRRVHGGWSRSTYASDDRTTLRIRHGVARVRVLAYDEDNRWPTRGPWRVIRP